MNSSLSHIVIRHLALAALVGAPIAMIPACGGNPVARLCDDVCNCEGCSDSELEDCKEGADEAQSDAEREGCAEEYDAYADCLDNGFKCDDDNAVFTEDCASEASDLNDCGVTVPGVGNVCERAAEICGGGEGEGEVGECSGQVECLAQCIVDLNSCEPDPVLNCLEQCS